MTTEKAILIRRIGYTFLIVAILAEIIFLYRGIFVWMKMAWFKYPPDRFGPYVPLIFLCIFFYRLIKKPLVAAEGNSSGLTIILIGLIIFLIGYAADIHIIQAVSFILTMFGMVVYIMGLEWGGIMLFPFFFLILMLPTISFLLESTFGVLLRNLITVVSGIVLNLTGGIWEISNSVLYLNEIDLPIQYYRYSISSPLALLIQIFIAAEFIFTKNKYKIIFVLLSWVPLVTAAHSMFTVGMGWAFEHDHIKLSRVFWESREWLPAVILMFMLLMTGIVVKSRRKIWSIKKYEKK
jgi:hypothetical protein